MSANLLKEFADRNENITKAGFIESEYEKYCNANGLFYLGTFAGFGRIIRKIDKILNGGSDQADLFKRQTECIAEFY